MSAICLAPVTVRRLPIPADSCAQNGQERPEFASCDNPIADVINLPESPNEWLCVHPDGFRQLGAVLRPVSGIVRAYADREGIAYAEAVQSLIAEHFVLRYETYVAKFDCTRGLLFLEYCKVRFVYLVRESHAHRSTHLRTIKAKTTMPGALPTIETDRSMSVNDCQLCRSVALEDRQADLQSLATLCERLKELEPTSSFVLWNHTGLGRTYDDLGQYLGISPKTVKQIHVGAVSSMRRMLGVKVG